jgi:hypothetical protein
MKNNTTKTVIFTMIGLIGFIVAMSAQRFVRQSQAQQAQMRAELDEKVQDEEFRQQLSNLSESQQQLSQQFSNVLSQLPDATGNDQNEGTSDDSEGVLLAFPESEIVKVETAFYSYDDPERIADFTGGIRALEVSLTEEDAAEMLDTEDKACISFTAADGTVHDYYYTQDHYLIYGDLVYYVEDLSPLINVMDK